MPDTVEQVAPGYRPPGQITILGDQPQQAPAAGGDDLLSRIHAQRQQEQAQQPPQPAAGGDDLLSRIHAQRQQEQQDPGFLQTVWNEAGVNAPHQVVSGVYGISAHANRLVANAADLLSNTSHAISQATGLPKEHVLQSIADWARQGQAAQQKSAQEWAGGREDWPSKLIRGGTEAVLGIPEQMIAAHLAGPAEGFAALAALTEADKGPRAALEAGVKGLLTGRAYEFMGPASRMVQAPVMAAAAGAGAKLEGADDQTAIAEAIKMGALSALTAPGGVPAYWQARRAGADYPTALAAAANTGVGVRDMARNAPDVHIPALFPNRNPQKRAAAQYMQDVVGANVNAGTASGNVGLQFLQKGVDVSPIGSYITAKETAHNIEKQRAHADYLIEQAKPETPAADHYKAIYDIADDPSSSQSVPTGRKDAEGNPVMADVQMPVNVGQFKPAMQEIVDLYSFAPGADKSISGALSTAETILNSPNHIPLKTAEVGLSSLKEEAMSGTGRAAGLAKSLVPKLQAAIDASARDIGGPEAVEHLQEARVAAGKEAGSKWLSDQFQLQMREGEFERAQRILNKWNDMNPAEKRAKFRDPEQVSAISNFLLGNKMLAQNPNPSGTGPLLVAQSQLGLLFYNPWTAVQTILGTGAMSKLFHSRFGNQLLTEGMHTNPNSPRGRQIGRQINAIISPGRGGTPPPQPGAAPDEPPGGGAPPEDEGGGPPPPPPPGAPPGAPPAAAAPPEAPPGAPLSPEAQAFGGTQPEHDVPENPRQWMIDERQRQAAARQGFIDQAKAAGGQEAEQQQPAGAATRPWYEEESGRLVEQAKQLGVVKDIENLSAQRLTAAEVVARLKDKLASVGEGLYAARDKANLVRATRNSLGIPSMDDKAAFENWISSRSAAAGPEASPEAQQAFRDKVNAAARTGEALAPGDVWGKVQPGEVVQTPRGQATVTATAYNAEWPHISLKYADGQVIDTGKASFDTWAGKSGKPWVPPAGSLAERFGITENPLQAEPSGPEASPEAQQKFLDKVTEPSRLQKAGDEALQRMRDRGNFSGTKLPSLAGGIDPADIKDMAIWGASRVAGGLAKFTTAMIDKFGAQIEPHIERLYNVARQFKAEGATGSEQSTRVPTAVSSTEDPMSNILTTGYDSWKRDPEKMANNINAMLQYPNFLDLQKQVKSGKLSIPDAAEEMINRMQDNLEWLHDNMSPEFRQRARLWYDGTNTMAKRWAKQYGTTPEQAAGAMAVNSPKTEWFLNAERARRLVEFWKDRDSMQWDPRMGQAWRDKVSAAIPEEVRAQLYRRIQGKSFNDVRQEDRPVWFRLYDEAVNPKEYPTLTPEGKPGDLQRNNDGSPTAFSFAYLDHIAKSMSILEDGSKANIHAKLGLKHKVRNFFNNIINPNSARDHTTMDTHAVGAALLRPMSQKSLEVDQNFGGTGSSSSQISGEQGTYALYKEAYRRAAAARDLLPREMQSITWEGIRSMFSPEFKGPQANKAMIDSLWKDVSSGKITADEARERALQLGGGFDRPAWYPRGKWNTGLAEEPGSSGDSR